MAGRRGWNHARELEIYPRTAAERARKLQEARLGATTGKIKWWQGAELVGISGRKMRR
ncbi:MAG TPA: hypothetical protein VGG85_08080 [Terracidiphilus sp.]